MGWSFDVVLHSPLGPRPGTLTLYENGAGRSTLALLGTDNPIAESAVSGNRIAFSGSVETAVGTREYRAAATVENGTLSGEIIFYLRTAPIKIPLPVPMRLSGSQKK